MSAVVAFNSVLVQFIKELSETFPEDEKMRGYHAIVEATCVGDTSVGVDAFMKTLGKFPANIRRHDESMFDECAPLFGRVDVGAIWKTKGLSEENKNVFWDYLQALMSLCDAIHPRADDADADYCGSTTTAVAARQALTALRGGDIESVMGQMMPSELTNVMGQMIKGVDMNDVMALAQGIDQQDIEDVLGAIDPSVLASFGSGGSGGGEGFSMETMMNVAKNIDPKSLMKIAGKFDKNTLARVASQVDQEGLMNVLGVSKNK